MKPQYEETTAAYAARLQEKAQQCDFGDSRDDRVLQHLIQTIDKRNLIQKAINKKWNLNQFLTRGITS
jgi:hypothetical protein